MKSRTLTRFTTMSLFAALALPVGLAAQSVQDQNQSRHVSYSIRVLPTLGGTFGEASAWGINNRDLVTGISTLHDDAIVPQHGFLWSRGLIIDLGSLGGPISLTLTNPNDSGEVVGYSTTSTQDLNAEGFCNGLSTLVCLPFVWEKGVMTPLPTLGGTNGQALGINKRGQIVGQAEGPEPDPCSPFALAVSAVIWRDGHIQQVLPPFAGSAAVAGAINDNGDADGLSGCFPTIYAVLWRHGKPLNLGNLGGVFGNIPSGLNNRDQVVGQSDLPGDTVHHAFLWENGVMSDLGSLSAALPTSVANEINTKGQVVGFAQDANADDSSSVAWVWQNGVMTDLNELISANSPLFLMEALSINDRGDIAGFGRLSNGEQRGFVLTPCNENEECREDDVASLPTTDPSAMQRPPANPGTSALGLKMQRPFGRGRWAPWYRGVAP